MMVERHGGSDPVLRGRERELAAVHSLFSRPETTGGGMLLEGEPGIGKTALLARAGVYARSAGFLSSDAVGFEAESGFPFAALEQALRGFIPLLSRLPAVQEAALRSALGLSGASAPEPFLVGLATLGLLVLASDDAPVVLFVDDAQWLDQLSDEALAFAARRVGEERITFLCTARTGSSGALIESLQHRMTVQPIGADAAAQILIDQAQPLDDDGRRLILEQSAGNPLALHELPKSYSTSVTGEHRPSVGLPLTDRLVQSYAGRLGLLAQEPRAIAIVAALGYGRDLSRVLEAATAYTGRTVTLDAVDALAERGLVRVDGDEVRYRHPLARSAVVQSSSPGQRVRAHRALAHTLRDEPLQRAWHLAQAVTGIDDEIADELETAVAVAISRGAVGQATWFLERAAGMTSAPDRRAHRLLLAARQARDMGRQALAERLVGQTAFLPLSNADTARVELVRESFTGEVPGDGTRIRQLCVMAVGVAPLDLDLALDLLECAATRCWWSDTGAAMRSLVVDCLAALPAEARSDARYVGCMALAEPVLRVRQVNELLEGFAPASLHDAVELRILGFAAYAAGNSPLAVLYLDRAEDRLRSDGRIGLLIQVLGIQMAAHYGTGEWGRSSEAMHESAALAGETGQPVWETALMLGRAQHEAFSGELDEALVLASEVELAARTRRMSNVLSGVQLARGSAWCNVGGYSEAFDDLIVLFDEDSPGHHLRKSYAALLFLADAAVHCSRQNEARSVVARYERLAETTPAPDLLANLSFARAVLAEHDAERLFGEALRGGPAGFPFVRAMTEQAFGSWLRRHRRVVESRRHTRSALATFELIGARGWAQRARSELTAAGEQPAQVGPDAPTALDLTPQQTQIARLAAQGLSNREIGERLFLSPRTIGSHLYRIFPKVGVNSRFQLGRIDLGQG